MTKIGLPRFRALFLCGCAAICGLAAAPARAADDAAAAADEAEGLTEIVVTAEKRPENLQKTPIAISVLGAEDIANRHIQSLADLSDGAIPSLRVAPFFSRNSALIVNIRGIGVLSDSNQPARDQGVGVYVDGVYLGRAQGLGTALYDIENIEVLKGPQGTLFGRNTEGGAVSIVTRKPTGEFHLNTTAGVGDYGSYKGELHLDLPEFHNFSIKVDGLVTHRDGLIKNPLAGQSDFNGYDKRGLRVQAMWKPAPNFSATYSYDTSYDASTPLYVQAISSGTLARAPIMALQPDRASVATVGVPQQPSVGKTSGHGLNMEWEVAPKLTIKSISSYRELNQSQFDNGSVNTSVYQPNGQFARYSIAQFNQYQYSQELQAIGEVGRLRYVVGALYYHEHVRDNAQAFNTVQFNANGTGYSLISIPTGQVAAIPAAFPGISVDRASVVSSDSYGVFGQATYTPALFNEAIHLTGGLRWSEDRKKGSLYIVNNATPNIDGVVAPLGLDASWSRVDPMINLAVDLARDVHVYGKWSTGYRSGGANSRSLRYEPFNPESLSMFEIGAKTEFLNRHARFNIAAYTGSYKNIQVDFNANLQQFDGAGNLVGTSTRTTLETINAPGHGRVKGVEAELTLAPLTGLTLTASYAYNSVKIPATVNPFPDQFGVIHPEPVKIYAIYTPKNTATAAIDYELPVGNVTLRAHVDGNYDSGYYASYNDPTGATQPKGQPGFVVNGRVALGDIRLGEGDAKLTVSVWTRNLFNEQHLFYNAFSPQLGGYGLFNDARTFGIEGNIRF